MTATETREKVLVVDDEPRILDSIRDLLEEHFEIVATTDGRQALDFLERAQIAVILADQRMPGMSGDDFLSRAQSLSDATRILITGYTDIDALIRAVNHGSIFTYVAKPWDPTYLKVTVFKAAQNSRELMERKRAAEIVAQQQEKLAEAASAFRRQSELLQSILDSMGEGVLAADENAQMVLLNPAAEKMIGPDASDMSMEARVETVGIYCPGTDRLFPTSELPLARAMRGETADGVELFIRNAEKPEGQYLSVNVRPLKDETGAPHGGVAVVRDITVAKRSEELLRNAKEEAERANRAKSEFLSRMSHELRTPLNSILGFAQLLEIGRLEEDQRDSVDQILRGGQHLLSLINEVLDLARIEAGRLSLSPEPVNSREAIQETIDLVYPLAQERGLTIVSEEIDEADCSVHADRQRLRQILLNLLSNAVKYNVENGGIRIRCERGSEGFLRISIVDTGIGIAPKDQQKLFQPFERVVDENRGIEGTGLGLALSKKLTESMGGSIGVQSSVGQGSTFWVELPVADKIAAPVPLEDELLPSAAASRPRTVLYVEDNSANFALMERIVARKSEVKLLRAAQGRLAMDLARAHRPDLVLLDLHLPDISGRDVLAALKEDDATKQIPVAVVSADATPGQIDRLLAAGAKSYITKPLDVRVILRLLDEVFRDLP